MSGTNGSSGGPSSELAELIDGLVARLQAGEAVDVEALAREHPGHADELRRLLPALGALDELSRSGEEGPSGVAPLTPPQVELASRVLGDYRIARDVGRGGMGVVYEAEQISLGRRVALKVLPFAATMDPRQLQRFHNEARAAASLHHEHIVPVHAVGQERGVHYCAMQFIEGRTLAEVIAGLRGGQPPSGSDQPTTAHAPRPGAADTAPVAAQATRPGPRDAAYYRRVAEWGAQAAEALEHAHALGVVHRDVKPANLMIDGQAKLWVTDFGLARLGADSGLTLTGDVVGTLRYMSPEQALAKHGLVDHRTDIYALGATLYELLTLRPAIEGDDREAILRNIAFEEPVRPRRVDRSIPTDLETVVLKALAKEPSERYATATELADDLRRWLGDQPIRAKRPSLRQRAGRWVRRHRALVRAAAAMLAAAALILAGGVGWMANDRATRRTATVKEVSRALADAAEWQSRRRVPEALSAARRAAVALAGGEADAALRRDVAARLADLELLAKLEDLRSGQWIASKSGAFNRALLDRRYGETFREGHLDVEALPAAEAGERIRGTTAAVELAAEIDNWTYQLRWVGAGGDRRKHLMQVAREADCDDWRTRLREALESTDRKALVELAAQEEAKDLFPSTLLALANTVHQANAREQAVALLRASQRQHPDDFWVNYNLAEYLQHLDPPRYADAISFSRVAVALRPQHSWAHNALGLALTRNGDVGEAIAEFRAAIRLEKDYAGAHINLGSALRDKGDVDGAIDEYKEAIFLDKDGAGAHSGLGNALHDKGDVDAAIAEHRTAIRLDEDSALAHNNLGVALATKGDQDEAIVEFCEAMRLDNNYAHAHNNLGCALKGMRNVDGVIAKLREAARLNNGVESPRYAGQLAVLGLGLLQQKKYPEAERVLRECLAIREKKAPDAWNTFNARSLLGGALLGQDKYADAEPLLMQGYEGMKQREATIPPPGKVRLPEALERLVQLYDALGQKDRADEWRTKLQAERARQDGLKGRPDKPKP
jgi:tetratricopeptide (TPR) repeat protein